MKQIVDLSLFDKKTMIKVIKQIVELILFVNKVNKDFP